MSHLILFSLPSVISILLTNIIYSFIRTSICHIQALFTLNFLFPAAKVEINILVNMFYNKDATVVISSLKLIIYRVWIFLEKISKTSMFTIYCQGTHIEKNLSDNLMDISNSHF